MGIDITKFAKFGGQDNVLAVKVDNSPGYREEATGTGFEWNAKDFNPNFGGLNRDATLIVAGKIYQTLPLYENLKTTGIYIYPEAIDLKKKTADVKVEAEVVNETGDYASITLSAVVVDADGVVRAKLDGNTSDLVAGQSEVFTASGTLNDARFWDVKDPYLYHVYSMLSVNGKVVDVCDTTTGFRQTEFKGGVGTGGVWLNGRLRLAHRLRAARGQRLGRPRRRVSRLDARLHARNWCARAMAIICAGCTSRRSGPTSPRATGWASLKSARRATRNGWSTGRAVGPARRGDARLDDFFPQQSQHLSSGRRATPSSRRSR